MRRDHMRHLRLLQFRIDRQRQRFAGGALGLRKIPGPVSQVCEALLQMQRHGIVDFSADAAFGEAMLQRVAALRPGRRID